MDCLRSGRDWDPGVGAALAGRLGAAASVPKKSSPSNESAGFVCFGRAASTFGGGLADIGGPEIALGGGPASSANRSGCGALFTCDGPPA